MADADSPSRSNRLKSAPSHLAGDYECSETTGSNDTSPSEPKPKRARPDTSGDLALARRLAREGARPRKPVTSFATLVDALVNTTSLGRKKARELRSLGLKHEQTHDHERPEQEQQTR